MSYFLLIRLKGIRYSGNNIGREIKCDLKVGNQVTKISIRLPSGKARSFDKIVFQKTLKEKNITLPVSLKIIETMERYQDLGASESKLKIKAVTTQKHTVSVKVKGIGRESEKTAILTFILESTIESTTRYITDNLLEGWLQVKFEDGSIHSLPQLLKVEIYKTQEGREYFNILEGAFKGKKASIALEENGKSYLSLKSKHRGSAKLVFDQTKGKVTIIGLGTYNVIIQESPVPSGKYDLEIPEAPHRGGNSYLEYSKYARTWFHIDHQGARFLHVGRRSLGCITVTDKEKWTEIYDFLIRSRKNTISIGEVLVKQ